MPSMRARLLNAILRVLTARKIDPAMPPRVVRVRLDRLVERFTRGQIRGARIEAAEAAGLPAEWIIPDTENNGGVLLYLHGGGYLFGSPRTHRSLVASLARKAHARALVIDYRLAPEHPFPAAPLDCYAVLEWVAANGAQLGIDGQRIAVGGDSAGGNLSAVVSQMARDRKGPRIALQLLVYPATRMGADTASYRDCGDGYFLTATAMKWFFDQYLRKPADWDDPLASPLLAKDLSNLPPALVMTAGFDPLRDEGAEYADRLTAAGVPVEYICYRNQIHGFVSMAGAIDEGREFLDRASGALRRAWQS